jgi:hypothetical protein
MEIFDFRVVEGPWTCMRARRVLCVSPAFLFTPLFRLRSHTHTHTHTQQEKGGAWLPLRRRDSVRVEAAFAAWQEAKEKEQEPGQAAPPTVLIEGGRYEVRDGDEGDVEALLCMRDMRESDRHPPTHPHIHPRRSPTHHTTNSFPTTSPLPNHHHQQRPTSPPGKSTPLSGTRIPAPSSAPRGFPSPPPASPARAPPPSCPTPKPTPPPSRRRTRPPSTRLSAPSPPAPFCPLPPTVVAVMEGGYRHRSRHRPLRRCQCRGRRAAGRCCSGRRCP